MDEKCGYHPRSPAFSHLATSRGFSLVEIMIASAIASVMALMMATFMANTINSQRLLEKRVEVNILMSSLSSILSAKLSCSKSLQGQAYDAPVVITYPDDPTVLAQANFTIAPDLKVERVEFEDIVNLGPNQFIGNLAVTVSGFRPRKFAVAFNTAPSSKDIETCGFAEAAAKFECMTATMNGKTNVVSVSSSTTSTPLSWNSVFVQHLPDPGSGEWGLTCQNGWSNSGCGYSDELATGVPDGDIRVRDNGCFSDDEETGPNITDPLVYTTCCRMSL